MAAAAAAAPRQIFHELAPGGEVSDETDFEEFAGARSPRLMPPPCRGPPRSLQQINHQCTGKSGLLTIANP